MWIFTVLTCLLLSLAPAQLSFSCEDSSWAQVREHEGGLQVEVTISTSEGNFTGTSILLPNHTLPWECAENSQHCNLLVIRNTLFIPAVGNIIFIPVPDGNLGTPQFISTASRNCDPTNLFLHSELGFEILWVACHNRVSNSLTYISYYVPDSTMPEFLRSKTFTASPGSTFSASILVPDCDTGNTKLAVVSGGLVRSLVITSLNSFRFSTSHVVLQNCSIVMYIDHSQLSDEFTVHCSSGVVVTYSTCEHAQYHNPVTTGIPFSSVIYHSDSVSVLGKDGSVVSHVNHTLGEIHFGRFRGDILSVITANRSLYLIRVSSGEILKVAGSTCRSDNQTCVLPLSSSDGSQWLAYDVESNSVRLVNVLDECVVVETPPPSPVAHAPPALMVFLPSSGSHPCQCPTEDSTTTSDPDTSATDPGSGSTEMLAPFTSEAERTPTTPTTSSPAEDVTTLNPTLGSQMMSTAESSSAPTTDATLTNDFVGVIERDPSLNEPEFKQERQGHPTVTIATSSVVVAVLFVVVLIVGVLSYRKLRHVGVGSRSRRFYEKPGSVHSDSDITGSGLEEETELNRTVSQANEGSGPQVQVPVSSDPPTATTRRQASRDSSSSQVHSSSSSSSSSDLNATPSTSSPSHPNSVASPYNDLHSPSHGIHPSPVHVTSTPSYAVSSHSHSPAQTPAYIASNGVPTPPPSNHILESSGPSHFFSVSSNHSPSHSAHVNPVSNLVASPVAAEGTGHGSGFVAGRELMNAMNFSRATVREQAEKRVKTEEQRNDLLDKMSDQ